MAVPATYVTVRDGKITVAYNRVGGYEILEISVLGPDVVGRFLEAWQQLDPWDEWTDNADSDGGLLVDFDQQVLMMFSTQRGAALRVACLDAVTRTWPGWQVRWAYDGIADLVDYVGGEVSQVRRKRTEPKALYWHDGIERMDLRYVVTIGETQAYGLAWNAVEPWEVGAGLQEQLRPGDRITAAATMPEAGMHLDPVSLTAGVWSAVRPLRGLSESWPRLWPGWTLLRWDDRGSEQLQRCAGSVAFPLAEPLGRGQFATSVMRTWSFFVAEDFSKNCRKAVLSKKHVKLQREDGWFRAREQTGITRRELSAALEAITRRHWPAPRWPKFDEPHHRR
ncbi:hypothetical protein [Dactylosporangium sp. NPDC006015]|uniref:hypothetical protein n=1 Tax=Dactylosporangium sp. NPDC006015 TaxID=3154576 RepID=UPI0033A8F902